MHAKKNKYPAAELPSPTDLAMPGCPRTPGPKQADLKYFAFALCVARWCSSRVPTRLVINRSRVRIPADPQSSKTLGKLLTYVPLSPSSIIW